MSVRLVGAFATLVAASGAIVSGVQTRFTARVDVVRVDALVTAGGRPVRDLGPADFEVFDNGVRQQLDVVSFERIPINAILTLDLSASVEGDRLKHLRAAGGAVLDSLTPPDQAALVTFNHTTTLGSLLTTDRSTIRQALDRAIPSGNTALHDAVYAALMIGEGDPGRALVIAFSDGVDTVSWLTAASVLDAVRRSDAVVYGVSVSGRVRFLRELAELTGGSLIRVESTKNLTATFVAILEEFRQRYLLSYSPRGVRGQGWHQIEVRVKGRAVKVKARPGYLREGPGR